MAKVSRSKPWREFGKAPNHSANPSRGLHSCGPRNGTNTQGCRGRLAETKQTITYRSTLFRRRSIGEAALHRPGDGSLVVVEGRHEKTAARSRRLGLRGGLVGF